MGDDYGTENYGPPGPSEKDELGVTVFFHHVLTARGLVPRERARETSKSPGQVIVWGRGEAGSEIYYEGVRYVSEQVLQREKFGIQERLDAVAAERDKLAARAWALEVALTNLCDAATDTREKLLADVLAASRQGMAALDGRPIGSVKVVGPEGAEVESVRDDGTIAFKEPPPSGSILVSENVPRHAQDIAREYAGAERIAELEAENAGLRARLRIKDMMRAESSDWRVGHKPWPNDRDSIEMRHPEAWWLIARDDVQRVLDFLTGIRLGGGETIAAICDAAIHLLETGVHETEAVPADFLGGHEEASEDDDD